MSRAPSDAARAEAEHVLRFGADGRGRRFDLNAAARRDDASASSDSDSDGASDDDDGDDGPPPPDTGPACMQLVGQTVAADGSLRPETAAHVRNVAVARLRAHLGMVVLYSHLAAGLNPYAVLFAE
jgi:hypothetical protein